MPADDDLWRHRFHVAMAIRFIGVATFLLGVAIMYSDLVRTGGWPQLGAIIGIIGAIDATFAPRLLRKYWDEQDRGA